MRSPAAALRSLETREVLLLACFASLVVLGKAAMRWHLHVPGHAMVATVLFLALARMCVARTGSATAAGLLAGAVCAALGMGKGGPLIVLKLALPGLVLDAGAALPGRAPGALRWALFGALAGATGFFPVAVVEALAGAPADVVLSHALVSAGSKAAFGALGGWAAAVIGARLKVHGVLA